MRATLPTAALLAAVLGGCYATGDVGYRATVTAPSADVYVGTPDLVTVSPGVQVVADYDEPVFYTDGFYWRFYDGGWYRSNNYASGWFFVSSPPITVARIDQPYAYRHYRPRGYVTRSSGRYRPPETIVRSRATVRPEPVVRDRREVQVRDRREVEVRDRREPVRAAPVVRETPRAAPAPAPAPRRAPPPAKDDRRDRDRDRDHDRH